MALDRATVVEAGSSFAGVAGSPVEVRSMDYHTLEAVKERLYQKLD